VPAHPRAYDDLWQVYAEETNARSRGYLVGGDRFNNRRPSLTEIERSPDSESVTDYITPFTWSLGYTIDAVPDKVPRKTSAQARRAGRSGGAANKRRWEKKKAARKQAAARRRARSAKPPRPHREGPGA